MMEIDQLQQQNQIQEGAITQKITLIRKDQEEEISSLKREHLKTVYDLEQKFLQLIKDRDFAVQGREALRNELQRITAESQMKDCRISNLNEIIGSKEALIEKQADDCRELNQRIDALYFEKQKYMAKVETILTEQKELRKKDQTMFS